MAKHHSDLIMCRKQPGIGIGRLCAKCDGKCVVCDSYVRPKTLVRVCDECNYGSYQGRCVICGNPGVSDAYYCTECTQTEKDVRRVLFSPPSRPEASTRKMDTVRVCDALRTTSPSSLPNPPPSAHPPNAQRDGCPKIVNLGQAKTDMFYERKKFGFKQR
jgi:PHD finger-like domain-containing protein 5A